MTPVFATEIRFDDGVAVVALEGELDLATAPCLQVVVSTLVDHTPWLALDFSGLRFVDSFGYGTIIGCVNEAHDQGARVAVRNLHGEPLELATRYGLVDAVDLAPSLERC